MNVITLASRKGGAGKSTLTAHLAGFAHRMGARCLIIDADPHRSILVVDAQGDDRALEPRVGHSRHRQQQLAGQEGRLVGHAFDNATRQRGGQVLKPPYGGPKSRFIRYAKEL